MALAFAILDDRQVDDHSIEQSQQDQALLSANS